MVRNCKVDSEEVGREVADVVAVKVGEKMLGGGEKVSAVERDQRFASCGAGFRWREARRGRMEGAW